MSRALLKAVWLDVPYELELDYPKRISVLIDKFERSPVPPDEIRILVIWEPTCKYITDVMEYPDFYSYVFTYHQHILDNNLKSVFFIGITVFVDPMIKHEKRFSVSSVIGDKQSNVMPGYRKRHELWFKRHLLTIPEEFYVSGIGKFKKQHLVTPYGEINFAQERQLGDRKDVVFDSMFHIAIENNYGRNFFTEKIVDCFMTKTVPIYIGAENIGDFFNKDGIISVKTVDEAINACNLLTEKDYYDRMDAIKDNYQRSLGYLDYNKMLTNKILEILP